QGPTSTATIQLDYSTMRDGDRSGLATLATRAGIPAHRIQPTVTALRRLLQVEGYPVLTLDADGRTAKLDVDLLVEQFGLSPR
ncbi:hypothetical protein ACFQ0D_27140, partial [Micromonospora zhanjiangensis]